MKMNEGTMEKWVWLLMGLAATGSARAVETLEASLFDEMPMVLTASRISQSPLDTPAPVTVLDRETIRASGFTEIQDLLRLVPGFLVADWPTKAANVVNRGMGDARAGRLQVLIDGRSVYDPFDGRVHWDELPIRVNDIDRVEVVRNAAPATYGANAFQGVINIITRLPVQEPAVALQLRKGDHDIRETAVTTSGQLGMLDWRLGLSWRAQENFEPTHWGTGGRYHGGEKMRRDVANLRLDYSPSATDQFDLQFGFSRGDDQIGEQRESLPIYYYEHDRTSENSLLRLGWKHAYGGDSEVSLQYYYYHRLANEEFLAYNGRWSPERELWVNLGGDSEIKRHDLEYQQTHRFSGTLTGLWGGGVRHDQVRSDRYLTGLDWQGGTQWQGFANLAWQATPSWLLNLGGMLEKHYYTDTLFSPRLAANYRITPNQTLRVSAGRGYRAPTVLNAKAREMIYYTDGRLADVELWSYWTPEPEEVRFTEIGYVARFPAHDLAIDARIYQEDYRNTIDDNSGRLNDARDRFTMRYSNVVLEVPPTVPDVPDLGAFWGRERNVLFYNMGGARARGGEIHLDWRHPWAGRFLVGYAVTDIQADAETALMEQDFENTAPRYSFSLLWSKALTDRLTLNVGHYRVDDMEWLNDGDDQPGYKRTDLKLAWRLGKPASEDEVALTVQNLGDPYSEFRGDEFLIEKKVFMTLNLSW